MYLTAKLPVNTNQGLARVLDLYPSVFDPANGQLAPSVDQPDLRPGCEKRLELRPSQEPLFREAPSVS